MEKAMLHLVLSALHFLHSAAIVIHVILVFGEAWHIVGPMVIA
jgi:hypothetical protein